MGFPSFLVFAKTENLGHGVTPKSNSKLPWQEKPEMPGEEGTALTYLSAFFLMIFLGPWNTNCGRKKMKAEI